MTDSEENVVQPAILNHVALVVSSLDKTGYFYQRLFNLRMLNRVRMKDHCIQYLDSGTGARIELIQYDEVVPARILLDNHQCGFGHTAWQVNDVSSTTRLAEEIGGYIICSCVPVPELSFTSSLIRDPDGSIVELVQMY